MRNTRGILEKNRIVSISKFLSFVLRHRPEKAGISLDAAGWVEVSKLIAGCKTADFELTLEELSWIVANSDKQRFEISEGGLRI